MPKSAKADLDVAGSFCVKIHIGFDVAYECTEPTPTILMLSVHPSRIHDLLFPDHLYIQPHVPTARYIDMFGNICTRLVAPVGETRISTEAVVLDSGAPDPVAPDAIQIPVGKLPDDVLVYSAGQPLLRDRPAHRTSPGRCSATRRPAGRACRRSATSSTSTSRSATSTRAPTKTAADVLRRARRRLPRLRASRRSPSAAA